MRKLNHKGFTLIEVLATIVIIAVLGLVAIPSVLDAIDQGKNSSYDIMVKNIKTASQSLFEELEYAKTTLYHYNKNGVKQSTEIAISENETIHVNLQTLVSNGFLNGTNNQEQEENTIKSKVILNPKTNTNIGECAIIITKQKGTNNKVTYKIENDTSAEITNEDCPTNEDYQ